MIVDISVGVFGVFSIYLLFKFFKNANRRKSMIRLGKDILFAIIWIAIVFGYFICGLLEIGNIEHVG